MIHGSSALQIPALSDAGTQAWVKSLSNTFTPAEVEVINQACQLASMAYADKVEATGLPLMQHAIGTAAILISLHLDAEAIAATILYASPNTIDNWQETLQSRFGTNIRNLVAGLIQIEQAKAFGVQETQQHKDKSEQNQQVEGLRKMLLAMVQDMRVVLIKLAERTQTLRSLGNADTQLQHAIAQEVQGIYAPLANRLGVWQLKWEMEDLSLRYLEPKLYKQVAKSLDARRLDREQYIAQLEKQLKVQLSDAGIHAEVAGRPKHIYSIINKMRRKNLHFEQLFDIRAVRILVDNIEDCYTALSVVQVLWKTIPGEFDDYIAKPKSNHYRSLHTAVTGPKGLPLEVQIRTHEMHAYSELGVAAHWRYKEGGKSDAALDEKIAVLRQLLSWQEEPKDNGDLLQQFNTELFQENIYVFTPQGKVIDLAKGATPIDFAYALHTDLGHRIRGAKVDNHIVPLTYQLQNGQHIEILTHKVGAPSRDWLSTSLGYLKTNSARAKVRYWFKHQHAEDHIAQGRTKLDKALHRIAVDTVNHEKLAQQLNFNKLDDCLNVIGRGDVSEHQLTSAIQQLVNPKPIAKTPQQTTHKASPNNSPTEVILEGVGNLQTNIAKCCKPVFPDPITAYVTRGRGVTIHRQSCRFMTKLTQDRCDRLLNAVWRQSKK